MTEESTPRPVAQVDWKRVFPDADHRWMMGLRQGVWNDLLAPRDPSGQVLTERARWLEVEPAKYAALMPTAESVACSPKAWPAPRKLNQVV